MKETTFNVRLVSWGGILLLLATIVATCGVVFSSDYGFSDDFSSLPSEPITAQRVIGFIHFFIGEGRCLFTLWIVGVFGQVHDIGHLRFIRLLTLFALFFSSIVFYKLVCKHLVEDRITAYLMGAIFAINPSFLIMSGWAAIGYDAFASLMGLSSSYVLLKDAYFDKPLRGSDIHSGRVSRKRPAWTSLFFSGLLLFASLASYQPGAMLYWTGAAIWMIGRFEATLKDWIRLAIIVIVFLAVLGAYFLFASTLAGPQSRFHVSTSIIRRIGWFVLYPFQHALSYPLIHPVTAWSIAALLILSLGLWLYCRGGARTMWIPTLTLLITPLTVLPTIFAANHYDVSRTRVALYGVLIVLWCVTFEAIIRFFHSHYLKLNHLLVPLLVLLIALGQYHLQRYLIIPQIREESVLLMKLQDYVAENPNLDRPIVVWPPRKSLLLAGFSDDDEMGIASSSQPWAVGPLIHRILAGITNRPYQDITFVQVLPIYDDQIPPENSFKIDLRQLHAP